MSDTLHTYTDADFVYVDVPNKKVIGLVEWQQDGNAKRKEYVYVQTEPKEEKKGGRPERKSKRYYPWCSYVTAKKVYNIEGKYTENTEYDTFDSVLDKAVNQTFWNT